MLHHSSKIAETMLGNTVAVQPHRAGGCRLSTDAASVSVPCCFVEPFVAADFHSVGPSFDVPDASSGMHAEPSDLVHRADGVQLYSELQSDGHVTAGTERPSSMRACPSTTSMLSYARSDMDSSTNGPACRICDSAGDGSNRLISPCRCSGTSKFVHEQCLNVCTLTFTFPL